MANEINLAGKVAIVTGAGSGLGRVMTLGLAARGAKIAALDVNEDAAKKTAAEAPKGAVAVMRTDVRPDFMLHPIKFWEVEPERWQQLMDVNVRGPFLLARAAVDHLVRQKWGRIINVTTSFNTMLRGANMPYGQSKAALEAASSAWAEDLRETGVTVNVLVPGGAADTPMVPPASRPDRSTLVRPDVMVAPVCFLVSDLSNGITGKRFIGREFDPTLAPAEAMKLSAAPIGWPELADTAGRVQAKTGAGGR